MEKKIYVVPRWSGNEHSDWYDWFGERVQAEYSHAYTVLAMPHWNRPVVEEATEFLKAKMGTPDASTILIGHSVGCQAILRFLREAIATDPSIRVGGLLMVAGWFEVDEIWDDVIPWLDNEDLNYPALRQAIGHTKVILSDNDPFTADYEANAKLWTNRLNAEVTIYPQKAHFNTKIAPEILLEFGTMLASGAR